VATQGGRPNYNDPGREPPDRAIGRSRGGLTTKIHLACDGQGRPLSLWLTGGNVNDSTELGAVLAGICVPRLGSGRPRTRPDRLLGDKGYSSRGNRALLAARGVKVTIPEKDDQAGHRRRRGSAGGRPFAFDPTIYKRRNVVERGFNRFKHWRGLASRFDKTAVCYLGGLTLAALLLWTEA
jgi:transposase